MTEVLRVALADDELLARKRLARLLAAVPGVDLVGAFASADELLEAVASEEIDLVFLDISMPGLTGLEARALLPDDGPLVVFVTAHPQHAVEAFDLGAIDYLVKPVEPARLRKALDRVRRQTFPVVASAHPEPLAVSTHDGVVLLKPERITHAILEGELVTLESLDEGGVLADATLRDLADKLSSHGFERVHRRVLLNLRLVRRLKPVESGGYLAVTVGEIEVPISRQAARRLRQRFGL